MPRRLIIFMIVLLIAIPVLFYSFQYFSRAAAVKANIVVDVTKTSGPFPDRWKALAQGGEESGVRMLEPVVSQVAGLYPRYIRLDHIYDFYDVVSRNSSGNLSFNFSKLDQTICDIYHTGAKPFLSLGYMPPTMSDDGSLVGKPKNWNEWTFLVQKTVEHYSSKETILPCGNLENFWKTDIYYEVWNEPDLETFGKWRYQSGGKSYSDLYFYSVKGAQQAQNVLPYKIGGPVTTALYKNWIQKFLDFVITNNLRIDFISWHHYSKKTNDFTDDIIQLNKWLSDPKYNKYEKLPRVISEWGYSQEKNPIADTDVEAAYTVASLRNLINARLELAFLFEIKDGPLPSWGILTNDGKEKSRYQALKLLNALEGNQLIVDGEGSNISAIASKTEEKIVLILTNYDESGRNYEAVPVVFKNLDETSYSLTKKYPDGRSEKSLNLQPVDSEISLIGKKAIIMPANTIVELELVKTQ